MNLNINNSLQFRVNKLSLIIKSGTIDITNIFEELNLYDSLFIPVLSAKILISDSLGLYGKLLFDGSETLMVDISKDDNINTLNFVKSYRLYSVTDKINVGLNSQRYILNFVSDELFYSDQKRINQSYENTYSEVAKQIIVDHLLAPSTVLGGYFNDSLGVKKIVIPNLKPLEALQWCAKRAINPNGGADFIFFQNAVGYNFASLSRLLSQTEILDIKFQLKNVKGSTTFDDFSNARALQVVSQVNAIDKIRSGVDASKFIGFDPITGMFNVEKNISYADHYSSISHSNPNPNTTIIENREGKTNVEMYDARKSLSIFGTPRQLSEYIKKNDPESISKEDDTENYKSQRLSVLQNLINKRLRVVVAGNFQLTSGMNVNLMVPNFGVKETGDSNEDQSLSGKYIIIAARHIIGFHKHETILEVASSSSNKDGVYRSSSDQLQGALS